MSKYLKKKMKRKKKERKVIGETGNLSQKMKGY